MSYRGSTDQSQPSKFARYGLTATTIYSSTPRDLKKSFKQRFKGSSSKGHNSSTPRDLRLLEMGERSQARIDSLGHLLSGLCYRATRHLYLRTMPNSARRETVC
ncbi:hypothetical protein L195_g049183 [Trifolium pratense]|uniref:Uncharacterized protein n=1 Tax=Trifolium pratense TaxID=57577 RepID=A0A2K3JNE0_TRIPR|nr:hypothetical protein L195_g049183 [Trifolium pratense]